MAAKPLAGSCRHPVAVQVSTVHGSPSSQPLEVPTTHGGALGSVVVVVGGGGARLVVVLDDVVVEEDVAAVVLVTLVVVVVVLVVVVEQPGTGACWQPLAGSQVSVVQTFPSSQLTGPPTHRSAKQASAVVQALPSSHGVPSVTTVCVQTPA